MRRYQEIFPTRLGEKLAQELRDYSVRSELPESQVVRIALRHFFECRIGTILVPAQGQEHDDSTVTRGRSSKK